MLVVQILIAFAVFTGLLFLADRWASRCTTEDPIDLAERRRARRAYRVQQRLIQPVRSRRPQTPAPAPAVDHPAAHPGRRRRPAPALPPVGPRAVRFDAGPLEGALGGLRRRAHRGGGDARGDARAGRAAGRRRGPGRRTRARAGRARGRRPGGARLSTQRPTSRARADPTAVLRRRSVRGGARGPRPGAGSAPGRTGHPALDRPVAMARHPAVPRPRAGGAGAAAGRAGRAGRRRRLRRWRCGWPAAGGSGRCVVPRWRGWVSTATSGR